VLIAAEYNNGVIYIGGRWDFTAKVWANKAEGKPFDITPYTVTMTIGEAFTLTVDEGLTVVNGHEKEDETPAEATLIEATLTKEQVEQLKELSAVHFVIALAQEVDEKEEPDFLMRGDISVVIP
jgi:hypothetical protein